jgi:uncharacterized protein (DUF885 family)
MAPMSRWPVLLLLSGCAMPQDVPRPLADLYDLYLADRAALDPEWGTSIGLHDHDGRLTRYDDASWRARIALVDRYLALIPGDSLDARLWRAALLSEQYEYRRRDARTETPSLPLGAVSVLYDMLVKDYAPRPERLANINRRLRDIPSMVGEVRSMLRRPPRVWTESAIEDAQGTIEFLDELKEADGTLVEGARAAYRAYLQFLKGELLPRSDGAFAVGKAAYEFHLRTDLFLPYGADELERIGRREFDLTIRMLEAIAQDWPGVLEEMKHDHPKADELVAVYTKECARARQHLIDRDLVAIPSWERLEVVETPPFLRSSVPYAAYSRPGPLDAARIGHFYVTPVDKARDADAQERQLAAHNIYDIPGTVWHEAYPGHHLQFVYAKDIHSKIRKLNDASILSEGWGLYCEELAYETGYFTKPKERLMQLNWRLQRAARVLLDVSLHTGKMAFADAVKFLVEKVRMNEEQATGSVTDYTKMPTYFPSYLLGMLEIVRIREKFRANLGPRFTLRGFHERFLAFGNVPPSLIEAELEREWR